MNKIVKYNPDGSIESYGIMDSMTYQQAIAGGERVMKVPILSPKMDITKKVNTITGELVDTGIVPPSPSLIPIRPYNKRPANITNEQWQAILNRLEKVEKK